MVLVRVWPGLVEFTMSKDLALGGEVKEVGEAEEGGRKGRRKRVGGDRESE